MSDRHIRQMLELMGRNEAITYSPAFSSVKKGAALAFVAEQFGYAYADARLHGRNHSRLTLLLHPDPRPDAAQRAAAAWARYPQAGRGGPAPGLRPGTLLPLPEAQQAVDLLAARITFDITGKKAEKRMLWVAVAVAAGAAVGAAENGLTAAAVVIAVAFTLLMSAFVGIGFAVNRNRHAKAEALLRAADLVPVRDGDGRSRYLPPGAQPSGHGNPFAAPAQPTPPHQAFGCPPYPSQQAYPPQQFSPLRPHPQNPYAG